MFLAYNELCFLFLVSECHLPTIEIQIRWGYLIFRAADKASEKVTLGGGKYSVPQIFQVRVDTR